LLYGKNNIQRPSDIGTFAPFGTVLYRHYAAAAAAADANDWQLQSQEQQQQQQQQWCV